MKIGEVHIFALFNVRVGQFLRRHSCKGWFRLRITEITWEDRTVSGEVIEAI